MSATDFALRLRVEGDITRGEPVLLLHGLGDSLDTFWDAGWVSALGGRAVIAFDARGHGGSPRPADPSACSDAARVADALAVLDRAGVRRAHVLGYSMGGWTAIRLAAEAPHRVVSLLVGGAQPYGQSLEPLRQLIGAGVEAFVAAIERARALPDVVRARFLPNDPQALAAVVARDREAIDVKALRAPLFTWAGEHDALAPLVEWFAAEVPAATFLRVPRAGHFAAFDDPLVLRAARSWIDARSTSASSNMKTWSEPEASM